MGIQRDISAELAYVHPRWFILGIFATIVGSIWMLLAFSPLPLLLIIGGVSWTVLALLGHHVRGTSR